jgi:hypothetical protein
LRFLAQPDRMEKVQPCASAVGHTARGLRLSADADRADIEKVLAGDIAAFENIVRRWQGPLVNLAHRFCRERGRAEDMAQRRDSAKETAAPAGGSTLEGDGMKHDEIDHALSGEVRIAPSPEFVNRVMHAVRRDGSAPAPIPFPWKRAAPGFGAGALALRR